ncbi:Protein ATP11 [Penicillium rolfsii]|nr:Protein ATP11 [Penicillium rolfsii]
MASRRLPGLQSVLRGSSHLLRPQQRRWAQVHDVRFLASHHDPKHVLEKYRSKLDEKAKQEGLDSIDALKEAYRDKINNLRRQAATVATPEPDAPTPAPKSPSLQSTPPAFHPPPPPKAASATEQAAREVSGSGSPIKPLSTYIDVEKIRELPAKEIEALWRLRFANSSTSICAAIPLETYLRIAEAARHNPQFILPLPRQAAEQNMQTPDGSPAQTAAEIHFLQWAFHPPADDFVPTSKETVNNHTSTVIFTNLGAFKMHGSFAQPHTTVTHHLDLADDKGLVLMHGQVMPDRGVSTAEATWLVSSVQRFYDFGGQASGRKGELVRMFTRGDVENFKVEELMEETERVH